MTNEELNTALYKKMFAEQETFRKWLCSLPPEQVLDHAYEYTVREDFLYALEDQDLTDEQAKKMIQSPQPLLELFRRWEKRESSHMDDIWETMEETANAKIRKGKTKER